MRCYFCLEEHLPSVEHVFPLAIGGLLTTDRVCTGCNSTLGSVVDADLINHLPVLVRRSELKLPSNSGKIPDAFMELLGKGRLANDPSRRIQLAIDPTTGKPEFRLLYSAKEIPAEAGGTIRQISIDAKDAAALETILQRERKRAGLPPLDEVELARTTRGIVEKNTAIIDRPEVIYNIQVDFRAPRRGLVKIAYELACMWLGDGYLDDPLAARLREFVLADSSVTEPPIQAHFATPAEIEFFQHWPESQDCHIAFGLASAANFAITLKIFGALAAVVQITDTSERYLRGPFDHERSQFVCIDTVAKTIRSGPLIEEIQRIVGTWYRPAASTS